MQLLKILYHKVQDTFRLSIVVLVTMYMAIGCTGILKLEE